MVDVINVEELVHRITYFKAHQDIRFDLATGRVFQDLFVQVHSMERLRVERSNKENQTGLITHTRTRTRAVYDLD